MVKRQMSNVKTLVSFEPKAFSLFLYEDDTPVACVEYGVGKIANGHTT